MELASTGMFLATVLSGPLPSAIRRYFPKRGAFGELTENHSCQMTPAVESPGMLVGTVLADDAFYKSFRSLFII
jgi:hypothetical protein